MDALLQQAPWYKRWFWKIASKSLYPTIISIIGFGYFSINEALQARIRRFIPYEFRRELLNIFIFDTWTLTFFVLTVVFAVWGGITSQATVHFVHEQYKKLLGEHNVLKGNFESNRIDCYELFSKYLYNIYRQLGLGVTDRVSLYKIDLSKYSCIGRFSDNQLYQSKPTRLYPAGQGFIETAWQVGTVEDANSPDPTTNWAGYVQYHAKYGFTEEQLKALRMKSRSFFGLRLRDEQNQTIGVLMFESTKPNGLPFGKLRRFFNEHEIRNMFSLIKSLESHIPSIESAYSEGF